MTAIREAKAEGLKFFWARMHVGHTIRFIGSSWEDGGFSANENGEPERDAKGNTVAQFRVEELDEGNDEHADQASEWYYG